ncbi:MAG: MAPEG family protein [Paracoccaceae bacterium]
MMNQAIIAVALYAGLNGLVLMWLLSHIGKLRETEKISIGDGGNARLIRAMRGQGNFVENVPMILLLMLLLALMGVSIWAIHILGIALFIGRVLHARHFTQDDAPGWLRRIGFMLTFLPLLAAALGTIGYAIKGLFL